MHDVGKIGISDAILQKPGKLTAEEFDIVRTHTLIGGKILDGKTTAPNEIRGTSIEGAELHPLKAGDVMHIPMKTPHQVMLETGQTIDYLAIKVDAK